MKRKRSRKLLERLLLIHLVFAVSLIVVVVANDLIRERYEMQKHLHAYGTLAIDLLRTSAVDPVVNTLAYDRLPGLLNSLYKDTPEVDYVCVYDSTGAVAEYRGKYPGYLEDIDDWLHRSPDEIVYRRGDGGQLDFYSLLSTGGGILGVARIGLTDRYARLQLTRDILSLVGVALLGLLVSFLIFYYVAKKRLLWPLSQTSKIMQEFGNTDVAELLAKVRDLNLVVHEDEVGDMSRAFQQMIEAIIERDRELDEQSRKLHEQNMMLQAVTHGVGAGITLISIDYRIVWANEIVKRTYGDAVEGNHCYAVFYGCSQVCQRCPCKDVIEGHREESSADVEDVDRDGNRKWIHVVATPFRGNDGIIRGALEVRVDITQRMRTEQALRNEEEKFRALVENAPYGLCLIGKDGMYRYVNPRFTEIFGYRLEDVPTGKDWFEKAFPDESTRKRALSLWLEDLQRSRDGKSIVREFRIRDKNGAAKTVQARQISLVSGEHFVIYEDVTERRLLEKQYQQAQKMEAVGTLAGGIAHDFNNLLQVILGYVEMLLMDMSKEDKHYEKIQEIRQAAQRARELTQQILTFSRKSESKLMPVDLNREVKQLEKLLSRVLPKMIAIESRLQEKLKIIDADPAQIEQVMMNIAINARDAMPDGGKLIIETKNVVLDEQYSKLYLDAMPGEYVMLCISDTGQGMSKETLEHIFDPFFTTKTMGRGTGLGLAMVYGIVKNHGGFITCSSERGRGTVFKIFFPAKDKTDPAYRSEHVSMAELPRGTETILLVDDEKPLRDFGIEWLAQFGYTVLEADSGESALDIYQARKDEIALVILDLIMPGMGGEKCLDELLKIDPKVKVIISSGYSAEGSARAAIKRGALAFIRKPYDIKEVLQIIREALEKSAAFS